jgi:hypothetical protein
VIRKRSFGAGLEDFEAGTRFAASLAMKTILLTLATAAALAAAAGCDRTPDQRANPTPATKTEPAATGGTATTPSGTPTTPANAGTPSSAEKAQGSNPVQQQVDPKQAEQQRDFQQKGDGAGPKPGG